MKNQDPLNSKLETYNEILGLCDTLNYKVSSVFNQNIQKPNPTYYIGSGKVNEIAEFVKNNEWLDFAVFDCPLKSNQVFNLENKFGLRVIDRNTLILIIFLHHARTKEAKLQVEYAILNHQLPYIKELVRRSKMGEHPGYMTGGEYKIDEYYRLTRTRVRTIRQELVKITTSRALQRKHRYKKGFILVSLAGYTNAGKSSILKMLTKATVSIDEKMFSTVSPKTRRFRRSKILLTDTVGFIRDIPIQLIEAFKSTLEEIIDADHIMLIIDVSEEPEVVKNKITTCLKTIDQLIMDRFKPERYILKNTTIEIPKKPRYHIIFNKLDLVDDGDDKIERIMTDLGETISIDGLASLNFVSCKTEFGIEKIIDKIYELDAIES